MRLLTEIPYRTDSSIWFATIAERPWSVFLDSCHPHSRKGRFDILTADPYCTLSTFGSITEIRDARGEPLRRSPDDPFSLLRDALGERLACDAELPFCGGALGWFGYDLGRRIERLPDRAVAAEALPDMAIGLYDWAVVVDHHRRRSWLTAQGRDPRTHRIWWRLIRRFSRPDEKPLRGSFRTSGPTRCNLDRAAYGRAFDKIKRYIRDGDCYQVNFAQRFSVAATGNGWHAYRDLRRLNPAPFGAYLNTPFGQVLSSSPERLLQLRDGKVETKPIKGTRPRGGTPEGDSALAQELSFSEKDRAENLMIVDLLRNDISRVCEPHSVRVPKLFSIESFATVHHLVSTVTGRLRPQEDALSLLKACFPGGSITGAPKIRAMEIIEELEPNRRGVYCGSIGYIGFDGAMDSNIAIRTLAYNKGELRCWAGGGNVHDSDVDQEYAETFHKASAMLSLMEANTPPAGAARPCESSSAAGAESPSRRCAWNDLPA